MTWRRSIKDKSNGVGTKKDNCTKETLPINADNLGDCSGVLVSLKESCSGGSCLATLLGQRWIFTYEMKYDQ